MQPSSVSNPEKATKSRGKPPRSVELVAGEGIEHIAPADLIPNPDNARRHDERQVKQIAYSIRTYGFNVPIVIDEHNNVKTGHGRLMAANQLGLPVVPCIRRAGLNERAWREFVLADNRIGMNATWDMDRLTAEMKALAEEDTSFVNLGFDDDEIKELLSTTIELPDLGDGGAPGTGESREDLPDIEDANVAVEEAQEVTGDALAPEPAALKDRYHQLPPEEAQRAIRGSEERIPLAILLDRTEHDIWLTLKAEAGAKSDKMMWQVLVGLREAPNKPKEPVDTDTGQEQPVTDPPGAV